MTTPIIIREVSGSDRTFEATAQFGPDGAPYPIAVGDPFSENEEAEL